LNGTLMTVEEFKVAEPDDDDLSIYELIHGVLIVSPPPGPTERDPNGQLDYLLRLCQYTHPEGKNLDKTLSEQHIHFTDNGRRADRVIWTGLGCIPDLEKDIPSIAIEFVSNRKRDRTRDYEEKRREYLAIGVREYWVIDRFQRKMTVFFAPPAEPAEVVVPADGIYRTPLLPGFELPLAQLLSIADSWPPIKKPKKTPPR
jgi:Uma2 family endonuclease